MLGSGQKLFRVFTIKLWGSGTHLVEHSLAAQKPGVTVQTCNPSLWEVEAEGPGVQHQPQLHNGLRSSLGYVRPCLEEIIGLPDDFTYLLNTSKINKDSCILILLVGPVQSTQGWFLFDHIVD